MIPFQWRNERRLSETLRTGTKSRLKVWSFLMCNYFTRSTIKTTDEREKKKKKNSLIELSKIRRNNDN